MPPENAKRPPTAAEVRAALDEAIVELTRDGSVFRGVARYGRALAGPPRRLHGGLHAYGRVLQLLGAIEGHSAHLPIAFRMRLDKAIPLEEDVPFEGTFEQSERGFSFRSRFDSTDRLEASAENALPFTPDDAAPWRQLVEADAGPPLRTIQVRDSFPVHVRETYCEIPVDEEFRAREDNELMGVMDLEGRADAVFACVALDWIGAIGMGVSWRCRLYTTAIELRLADAPPLGEALRVLVDRTREEPEPGATAIEFQGAALPPTSLPVAMVNADATRIYGEGRITLCPVPGQVATFPSRG